MLLLANPHHLCGDPLPGSRVAVILLRSVSYAWHQRDWKQPLIMSLGKHVWNAVSQTGAVRYGTRLLRKRRTTRMFQAPGLVSRMTRGKLICIKVKLFSGRKQSTKFSMWMRKRLSGFRNFIAVTILHCELIISLLWRSCIIKRALHISVKTLYE